MLRLCIVLACVLGPAPAFAQTPLEGQLRLHIQQLEEQIRQLTGENERLAHELNELRAGLGLPATTAPTDTTGALASAPLQGPPAGVVDAPPALPGSIAADNPLIAPDGLEAAGPIDLSVLATGAPPGSDPAGGLAAPLDPAAQFGAQTAGLPGAPPPTALSGSPRDQYDLAYGYILTGDYDLAEREFSNWLASFGGDPLAVDAQFWLGESQFHQGRYRDAANAFLAVYTGHAGHAKAPDALLKLGMSLAALGEKDAACATFAEVGRKYPSAPEALTSRVGEEAKRTGC
jgi:tol-pal system protein YbgF